MTLTSYLQLLSPLFSMPTYLHEIVFPNNLFQFSPSTIRRSKNRKLSQTSTFIKIAKMILDSRPDQICSRWKRGNRIWGFHFDLANGTYPHSQLHHTTQTPYSFPFDTQFWIDPTGEENVIMEFTARPGKGLVPYLFTCLVPCTDEPSPRQSR